MKILVVGGAGFIGTNVCLEARGRGHEVIAFDNFVRKWTETNIPVLESAGVQIVRGDVRNPIDFDKLPWVPDGIVNLSAQCGIPYSLVSPFYDFEVNTLGALNVLEYSRTHGKIPVSFASSNKAYTNITNGARMEEREMRYVWSDVQFQFNEWITKKGINEKLPLDAFGQFARTPYGTSKVASDLYHQEYYQCFGVPTVVNRMSCIYGEHQLGAEDQAWCDFFIRQIVMKDGRINIFGTGKQVRDCLWGRDCARLYLDELEQIDKVKGEVYNIGGGAGYTLSLLEAIALIESLTGKKANLSFHDKRYGDQDIWISDITKIQQDLGWKPTVSPQEGFAVMIKNYQKTQKI